MISENPGTLHQIPPTYPLMAFLRVMDWYCEWTLHFATLVIEFRAESGVCVAWRLSGNLCARPESRGP